MNAPLNPTKIYELALRLVASGDLDAYSSKHLARNILDSVDPFVYPETREAAKIEVSKLMPRQEPVRPDRAHDAVAALATQVGGDHYRKLAIQPVEYIHANNIPFCEGSAIKYLTRWRDKGGVADLQKAKHFIEMLIDLEGRAK